MHADRCEARWRTSRGGVCGLRHPVGPLPAMDRGRRWPSAMSLLRGRRWQLGRPPVVEGAGQCRRTPTSLASWTAVTAARRGVQAGARVPGVGGSSGSRRPGFLRKRCGRPMLPEVRCARPSIDLPSLTLTRVIEHVFPRVQSDFRFSELLVCFADGVFGG